MDARMALDELPPERRYDLILGDAFTDLSVPYHLSTLEFQRKLAERLKPNGVLMQNLIDDLNTGGLFLGAYTLTLKQVFKHVYVVSTERQGVRKSRDTFVLVAFDSDDPLRLAILERYIPGHRGALEGSILSKAQIADLAGRCGNRVLTDDNAPVENLLEPVVRHRGES